MIREEITGFILYDTHVVQEDWPCDASFFDGFVVSKSDTPVGNLTTVVCRICADLVTIGALALQAVFGHWVWVIP